MKLTVSLIDHGKPREAIPVRAIPLLTDQFISADLISMALAGADCSFRPGLTAYIESEGDALQIPEADWFLILEQLQALDASLPYGAAGKYEWRHRSIAEIPAKAFVWADEFSEAYRSAFNNTLHLESSEGELLRSDGELRTPVVVPGELQWIAFEGFRHGSVGGKHAQPPETRSSTPTHSPNTKTSQLNAEIDEAKLKALDPSDYKSVWPALLELALNEVGAFTGRTCKIKGLEYSAYDGSGVQSKKWFTRDALRKRMNPNAR